ncbi:dual specificity protein kinase Ttk [Histoplasma capsulatum var. duboisii H88]|uniref:Dual specificity protein kinase Ttk n=1 Tax=Ajellomyces capsulatus (strain H88) TaxID=544711 RepID=F0UIV1_AJEC8|nr:dual specificity protein kinase Ttk [Histoplasma capsulatum var. duboisii H88]
MSRTRSFSIGDSSDDDFPEPIKFSASVKALLGEEDGSNIDISPRSGSNGDQIQKAAISMNGELRSLHSLEEKQVRIASPREQATGSPSPRIVRVNSPRVSPRTLGRESPRLESKDEKINGSDLHYPCGGDFITPAAPRTRVVRVTASRSNSHSPPTVSPSGTRSSERSSKQGGSRIEDRSFSGDERRREENVYRSGSSVSVRRTRPSEDTGMQRIGIPHPLRDRDQALVEKPQSYPRPAESRTGSPVPIQVSKILPEPEKLVDNAFMRSNSPQVPSSMSKSPLSAEQKDSSRSTREAPAFYHVPPFLSRATSGGQENDPPPTFKKPKSQGLSLLDKAEKFSVIYDDDKELAKPTHPTMSPRRPLAPKDNNTPHRPAPPPPKMSVLETATAPAGATSSQARRKRVQVTINRKPFTRLDCIGRGGSSRVYRVMAENCKIFALKRVNLEDVDPIALAGYKGEIDLLKKLENVDRVVRLFDYEVNEEKHALSVLMEFGESDLQRILTLRLNTEDAVFDSAFTRYYWKEMLECVQAVHEFDVVHSDLKPANFVLVKGNLKLIDFGIANKIQDDTVNVHREQQIGTPNYMAPEALIDINAASGLPSTIGKMMKVGKPSDVWSLGCILYKMVYGEPPFAHITKPFERIMAIPNPKVIIEFPAFGVGGASVPPGLIRTLKRCLQRDPRLRPTVQELLGQRDPFLYPEANLEGSVPMTQEMLGRILTNVVNHCKARGPPKEEDLAGWPAGFFAKIRSALEEDAL